LDAMKNQVKNFNKLWQPLVTLSKL
jgi:hypothetical protein